MVCLIRGEDRVSDVMGPIFSSLGVSFGFGGGFSVGGGESSSLCRFILEVIK